MFNQATAAEYFSVSLAEATEHLYARDRQKVAVFVPLTEFRSPGQLNGTGDKSSEYS